MQDNSFAVLGGTGALGFGLVLRLAQAGHRVIVGSRAEASAAAAVARARETLGVDLPGLVGMENAQAAAAADVIVLTVPFAQQPALVEQVRSAAQGKIVIDATVPLMPPRVGTVQLPAAGAAAVLTQQAFGPEVRVVSAFQNVAADKLQSMAALDCDVLVTSDARDAALEVVGLINTLGMTGYYAGPLANSAATEALTSLLITINRQFKCQAGIRITGVK